MSRPARGSAAGPRRPIYDAGVINDAATGVLDAAAVAVIDATVRAEMERSRQPGVALGLTDCDRTLAVRTYGFADLASQRPVTPDTLFEIGSIGKSFTAMVILQLVDEGRLDLDAPVEHYLPWLVIDRRGGDAPITVRHLLSHTSGIVAGIDATPEAAFQVWSLRDLPTYAVPGERFHYSNVGYKVLGLVLEAVEGKPYREILRERVLKPVGMRSTEPAITHEIRPRLAVGYAYLHDDRIGYAGAELAPAPWLQTATADGSIASTADDMCAFIRVLLCRGKGPTGRVLSAGAYAQMTTAHARDGSGGAYGYGLAMHEVDGRHLLGHGGSMVGYVAGMETDPEAGLGAIVLLNGVGMDALGLARTLLRIVRDTGDGSPPSDTPGGSRDAGRTIRGVPAGVYTSEEPGLDPLEILARNDPVLRFRKRDIALVPLDAADVFLVPDPALDEFPLRIERPRAGPPEIWHGSRRYVRAGAAGRPLPPPPADLRAIAGHYRSYNPWTSNFRVVLRGDQAWLVFPAPPEGFTSDQQLVPGPDGSFRISQDPSDPEGVRFDTVADGRALRAWLSGWPYYRAE
jgi:CubicO group peptidase (beta-lactamase class C family)